MQIVPVLNGAQLADVRALLTEYANELQHHICFKSFEQERAGLPGAYAPPGGNLWLASVDGRAAGCVALRPLEGRPGVGEVKRLYVRPEFRGHRIGHTLMELLITEARRIGYTRLWLDTLRTMKPAHAIYTASGFKRVPNSEKGFEEEIWCFELELLESR
ncbi:MAG TPA: GNAT family N-acetyltransferase [Verrucomicrobiae bacterium]